GGRQLLSILRQFGHSCVRRSPGLVPFATALSPTVGSDCRRMASADNTPITSVLTVGERRSAVHRKVVTLLLCDGVGSTPLGETVAPEALQGLLAPGTSQARG